MTNCEQRYIAETGYPKTLLMIEDNSDDVEILQTAFTECDVDIKFLVAEDGHSALDMLLENASRGGQHLPDLITLDLNLPGMNGFEVLAKLKAHEVLRKTPVIIFSGSSAASDIARCYGAHANCYIVKPTSFEDTLNFVRLIESFWFAAVKLPSASEGAARYA